MILKRLIIAAFLLSLVLVWVPQEAEAVWTTSIDPASGTVDVSPGSTGIATFTGTISNPTAPPTEITVIVTTDVPGATCTVSPQTFVISPTHPSQDFIITVQCPIGTLSKGYIVTIVYEYTQGVNSGSMGGQEVSLFALQYYDFDVDVTSAKTEMEPGETLSYTVIVTNNGNGMSAISLAAANSDELEDRGIDFSYTPAGMEIQVDETGTFTVSLKTSEDANPGEIDAVIAVIAEDVQFSNTTISFSITSSLAQSGLLIPISVGVIIIAAVLVTLIIRRKTS